MGAPVGLLADRSPNFGHLSSYEPLLASCGAAAEAYVYTDPNAALFKARLFGETLATYLIRRIGVSVHGDRQVDRIRALARDGVVTPEIRNWFDWVRDTGNRAVHNSYADVRDAFRAVEYCFNLGDWLHRAQRPDDTAHRVFAPPRDPVEPGLSAPLPAGDQRNLAALTEQIALYEQRLTDARLRFDETDRLERERRAREEADAELARAAEAQASLQRAVDELNAEIEQLRPAFTAATPKPLSAVDRDEFVESAQRAARPPLTEAQVRTEIDRALTAAGWVVQDASEMNLHHAGVAVREVSTAAGRADYMLYVEEKLVGVLEAKREGAALSVAPRLAARSGGGRPRAQQVTAWRVPLPFQYVSDGNEVRFVSRLDPDPRSRRVFAVHRPETVARWMREAEEAPDSPTLRARLAELRGVPLDPAPLRPAQVDAIEGLERSLGRDDPRALIQMATGAGKTYTVVASSYRLLKHAGAIRVLFLVDRNNLGRQTTIEFANYVTPDGGRRFTDLYPVQRLAGAGMLDSASVVVSTIQRVWKTLTGQAVPDVDDDDPALDRYDLTDNPVEVSYNADLPPEAFDLIVVDECHRSIYGRWRAVLEYFDAHIVGLTATPVAQTFGFFHQNLVSEYTFEQAVTDKVNVDFDVYRIRTEIGESGSSIPAETVVPVRDRKTRRERYQELDSDFDYTSTQLGRSVISKGQLRLVLETFRDRLFADIFPGRSTVPKTLIFAKDDNHAEEIVAMFKEVFARGDSFCVKITHAATRPDQLLQAFRNSPELRVAVTVDMIATGTDVRPLECVFFLRDVKSWSYFEQMKGRGARTIDPAEFQAVTPDADEKKRFVIVDAIGVTDSPRVDARPLNRKPGISLEKLLGKAAALTLDDDEVATLASRLSRLNQQIDDGERAELAAVAGRPLTEIAGDLARAVDVDAQEAARLDGGQDAVAELRRAALRPLASSPELRQRILDIRRTHDIVTDEVSIDILTVAEGIPRSQAAMRVVESFRTYMAEHRDEIAPLELAFRERREPHEVYAKLSDLAKRLRRPPYAWTPETLWNAYAELGKVTGRPGIRAGVVDLVSVLRYELGLDDEVRPYRSVIEERLAAWIERQRQAGALFTDEQQWWLGRVADVISTSVTIEVNDLDQRPFTERGGVDGFAAAFGADRAEALLSELDRELSA